MTNFVHIFASAKEKSLFAKFFDGLGETILNIIFSEILELILGQLREKIGE